MSGSYGNPGFSPGVTYAQPYNMNYNSSHASSPYSSNAPSVLGLTSRSQAGGPKNSRSICRCMTPSCTVACSTFLILCIVVIAIIMATLGPEKLAEGATFGDYAQTECVVYHSNRHGFPGKLQCGQLPDLTWYDYTCWSIVVENKTPSGDSQLLWLKKDANTLDDKSLPCVMKPSCDDLEDNKRREVSDFVESYGKEGSTFECYSHRHRGFAVVDEPPGLKDVDVILLFLLGTVGLLSCMVGLVVICRAGGGPAVVCQNWKKEMKSGVGLNRNNGAPSVALSDIQRRLP